LQGGRGREKEEGEAVELLSTTTYEATTTMPPTTPRMMLLPRLLLLFLSLHRLLSPASRRPERRERLPDERVRFPPFSQGEKEQQALLRERAGKEIGKWLGRFSFFLSRRPPLDLLHTSFNSSLLHFPQILIFTTFAREEGRVALPLLLLFVVVVVVTSFSV
jgi:hypothetical protein